MAKGQNAAKWSNSKELWRRWKKSMTGFTSNKSNKQMYNRMIRRGQKQENDNE